MAGSIGTMRSFLAAFRAQVPDSQRVRRRVEQLQLGGEHGDAPFRFRLRQHLLERIRLVGVEGELLERAAWSAVIGVSPIVGFVGMASSQ